MVVVDDRGVITAVLGVVVVADTTAVGRLVEGGRAGTTPSLGVMLRVATISSLRSCSAEVLCDALQNSFLVAGLLR